MFRRHWILLLMICGLVSFSGYSQENRIFIDYGSCTKGLIAANGDTVIPASYDNISIARHKYRSTKPSYYYLVQSGEEKSLINSSFQIVVPLGDHEIQMISEDVAMVTYSDQSKQLIYGHSIGEKTIVFKNYSRNDPNNKEYYCSTLDSTFVYNDTLTLVYSFPYQRVARIDKELALKKGSERNFFRVGNNNFWGVIDSKNTTIVPCQYRSIYFSRRSKEIDSIAENTFIQYKDDNAKFGIQNLSNSIRIPCIHDGIQCHSHKDSEDGHFNYQAYLWNNKKVTVQDLKSEVKTKEFDRVTFFDGYHYATNGKSSYILNDQLEIIDSLYEKRYYFGINTPYPRYSATNDWSSFTSDVKRTDGVVFIPNKIKTGNRRNKLLYQLHDFNTGKTSEESFRDIKIFKLNGETFYLGQKETTVFELLKRKKRKRRYHSVLFNHELNEIKSLKNNNTIYYAFNEFSGFKYQNKDGKEGVIQANGDTLIPCDYDKIKFRIYRTLLASNVLTTDSRGNIRTQNVYEQDSLFAVMKDGKMGVFSLQGDQILPAAYENIDFNHSYIQLTTSDSIFRYHSFDSLIVAYPKSTTPEYKPTPKPKTQKVKRERKQRVKPDRFKIFEQNDTLYLYSKQKDTSIRYRDYFYNSDSYIRVNNKIVDSNSRIIYKGSKKHLRTEQYRELFFAYDKKELIFFDSLGQTHIEKTPREYELDYSDNQLVVSSPWSFKKVYSGVFNLEKLKWTYPFEEDVKTYLHPFQTIIRGNYNSGFEVLDFNGNRKIDHLMPNEYGLSFSEKYIFYELEVDDGYSTRGLLDTNFQFIIEPQVIYIDILRNTEIIQIEDTLDCFTLILDTMQRKYCGAAVNHINDQLLIFKGVDSLEILDQNLKTVLPTIHIPELFTSENLVSLYGLEKDTLLYNFARLNEDIPDKKRDLLQNLALYPILKGHGYSHRYQYMLSTQFLPSKNVRFDSTSIPATHGRRQVGKGYFTTQLKYRNFTLFNELVEVTAEYDTNYYIAYPTTMRVNDNGIIKRIKTIQYFNKKVPFMERSFFYLTDSSLVPIDSLDFILPNQKSSLDALLLKKLNEAQALGLRCANIDAEIDHLATNYTLHEDGVRFWGTQKKHSIFIYYFDLIGIWKSPYTMTLDATPHESP